VPDFPARRLESALDDAQVAADPALWPALSGKVGNTMSITQMSKAFSGLVLSLVIASAAGAATLSEAEVGDFSGDFRAPTVIANGFDRVEGVWSGRNDHDLLAFTGLKPGAQTLTLRFAPISPIGEREHGFSAGGQVRWKTTPFQHSAWEGDKLGTVNVNHRNRHGVFAFALHLAEDFGGRLWLGLFNTHGSLAYTISAPGNAAAPAAPMPPAAVPLPGAAPLIVLALGALGAVVRRRRASGAR
jgi:hypothetical protein